MKVKTFVKDLRGNVLLTLQISLQCIRLSDYLIHNLSVRFTVISIQFDLILIYLGIFQLY